MHTKGQISSPYRQKILNYLKSLLHDFNIIVMGYGGWEDIFMDAFEEHTENSLDASLVRWCCFEDHPPAHLPAAYTSLYKNNIFY